MTRRSLFVTISFFAVVALVPAALSRDVEADPRPSDLASAASSADPVITAAGDIANVDQSKATAATAQLVRAIDPKVALTLGDNQYQGASLSDFMAGYDPTWGTFRWKTHPAIGNHEYDSPGASGYFSYFGARAPDNYYSYWVGSWRLISLDSNCLEATGCEPGSRQYEWLKAELAAHPARCTLAYWHHPRWSSGTKHGNTNRMDPFVRLLYNAGAEVILSGHEHNYERFKPQNPGGSLDRTRGIVQFVVGTGGYSLYPIGPPDPNSRERNDSTFGVLRMELHPGSYDFNFKPALNGTFRDSGSKTCH